MADVKHGSLRYTFEWDPAKAKENLRRHGISFDRAAEVFLDPLTASIATWRSRLKPRRLGSRAALGSLVKG
jgi:uncharacterized DUF497 family protein